MADFPATGRANRVNFIADEAVSGSHMC